jgi:hypothetical protein
VCAGADLQPGAGRKSTGQHPQLLPA